MSITDDPAGDGPATTPADLYADALACLHDVTAGEERLTVFDVTVPDNPPADEEGVVYPYLVAFPGVGIPIGEHSITEATSSSIGWTLSVTVVAGVGSELVGAVGLVRAAVEAMSLPAGVDVVEDTGVPSVPQIERDVVPARLSQPLRFVFTIP